MYSNILTSIAFAMGLVPLGFGINFYRDPAHAVSFFHMPYPSPDNPMAPTMDCMMNAYGVRNIYIGISFMAAAYFRETKTLGILLLGMAAVAIVDGFATQAAAGVGGWDHWGYSPWVALTGILVFLS
jgi:hypothetical protein